MSLANDSDAPGSLFVMWPIDSRKTTPDFNETAVSTVDAGSASLRARVDAVAENNSPGKRAGRILVLDGNTNQALASVRSLGRAGYSTLVASHHSLSLAKWSRYCSESYRLAEQNIESFASACEWARERLVDIVLPMTERSCLLLNADRSRWEDAGMTVGCAPDEILSRAFDKAETLRIAETCGVRIPQTYHPASLDQCFEAVGKAGIPCIFKPRRSNGWNGRKFSSTVAPCYINSHEEVESALDASRQSGDWPLVQEYVEGRGKGVFAMCRNGHPVAWFAHERLRDTRPTGSSSSLRRSIRLDKRLREPAERLLAAMDFHGPAMVEFRDDGENPPCLMEVNGRFWGSLQLAIDAGVDFPLMWVSILQGEEIDDLPHYKEGITLRWLWGDVKRLIWILRGVPAGYPGAYPTVVQGLKELFGRQPAGTRLEVWRKNDPLPGIGELLQGTRDLFSKF